LRLLHDDLHAHEVVPDAAIIVAYRGELARGPRRDRDGTTPSDSTLNGYHVIHWERGGLNFWIVSNLNQAEMNQLAAMLRTS